VDPIDRGLPNRVRRGTAGDERWYIMRYDAIGSSAKEEMRVQRNECGVREPMQACAR
jgi:hypothetical protein